MGIMARFFQLTNQKKERNMYLHVTLESLDKWDCQFPWDYTIKCCNPLCQPQLSPQGRMYSSLEAIGLFRNYQPVTAI